MNFDKKNKKTILYTPRWASSKKSKNQESSFLTYINFFIKYASENSNINFIIRPHPLMFQHFIENEIVKKDYFEQLKITFKKMGNISFDTNKDYLQSIFLADIFVSDYTSLLAEFFALKKPVIYLGGNDFYNKPAKKIISSFYSAKNCDECKKYLDSLLSNEDSKNKYRNNLFNLIIKNYGKATENIVNFIKKDFSENLERK